jgi:hypothetical protein
MVLPEPPVRGVRGEGDGPMTARKAYATDERQPVIHYEIEVGGKPLARNQLVTLERGIGYPAGKYRFQYAEEQPGGLWMLMFMRRDRRPDPKTGEYAWRYRQVWDTGQVRTIHRASGNTG